jgi:membrane protein DedA with SNARE-associated domain
MSDLITQILNWISLNPIWSGGVIFLVAMLESLAIIGLLVPGAMMMVGFGALIATDTLTFWSTASWAIAGAVVGDGISFLIGHHYTDRISTIWPFKDHPKRLQQGVIFFQRHGSASVVLGRFIGPIRAVIPLIAGMMRMPPKYFLFANILSAIVWAPLYLLPGIALGTAFDQASEAAVRLTATILLILTICWVILWLLKRLMPKAIANTLLCSLSALFLASCAILYWQPGYSLEEKIIPLQRKAWWAQEWQHLPTQRNTPLHTEGSLFNIQLCGDLEAIRRTLMKRGWYPSERLDWKNLLKIFSPKSTLDQLPVIESRDSGNFEALIMQNNLADGSQLLLRLWPSQFQASGKTIWLGSLSLQKKQTLIGLLFYSQSKLTNPAELINSQRWLSKHENNRTLTLIDATQKAADPNK